MDNQSPPTKDSQASEIKAMLSKQIKLELKARKMTKTQLAEKMFTSRSSLSRLLSPSNTSVTLKSIVKASHALGKKVQITIT